MPESNETDRPASFQMDYTGLTNITGYDGTLRTSKPEYVDLWKDFDKGRYGETFGRLPTETESEFINYKNENNV